MDLTHIDPNGDANMVDIGAKDVTERVASASGYVSTTAVPAIVADNVKKGDVCAVARIAGIMAAKRTPELIPLCHPLAITKATVDVCPEPENDRVAIRATVKTTGRTGVEMEALTAVTVAGLTVIDMIKAIDKRAELNSVQVDSKSGGASGEFYR